MAKTMRSRNEINYTVYLQSIIINAFYTIDRSYGRGRANVISVVNDIYSPAST
jgi:hypothetical protein